MSKRTGTSRHLTARALITSLDRFNGQEWTSLLDPWISPTGQRMGYKFHEVSEVHHDSGIRKDLKIAGMSSTSIEIKET